MSSQEEITLLSSLHGIPPIHLPDEVYIHDFSNPPAEDWVCPMEYSIGKYDEVRKGMYLQEHFETNRVLHMGLDIGGPLASPVHSCLDGKVVFSGYHHEDGDYGNTIITKHQVGERTLWILYGHLCSHSIKYTTAGEHVKAGQLIGWLGDEQENGGWVPHLHLQLTWLAPIANSVKGIFTIEQRKEALRSHPDPQLLIGFYY